MLCIYDGRSGDMVGDYEQICLPKKKKRNRSELKEVDAKTVDAGRGRRLFLFFLEGGSRFLNLPSLAGVCGMRIEWTLSRSRQASSCGQYGMGCNRLPAT